MVGGGEGEEEEEGEGVVEESEDWELGDGISGGDVVVVGGLYFVVLYGEVVV